MKKTEKHSENPRKQTLQRRAGDMGMNQIVGNQAALNHSGIPETLKSRVEQKSGISMDGVRVHYNSPKPETVQALAYTQGSQVFLGPGQERHLGHELGHVVQQMEGRVSPTGMINGLPLNDDAALEREADQYR